jgi:hypothetical protein
MSILNALASFILQNGRLSQALLRLTQVGPKSDEM